MGADITEFDDGFEINGHGKHSLSASIIDTARDHRIAMAFSIASLFADGESIIKDSECVNISYPDFYSDLEQICIK
jgi:3-phosphoshikimate 1-carboxyvinyltransferase